MNKRAFFALTPFDTSGTDYYSFGKWAREKGNELTGFITGGSEGARKSINKTEENTGVGKSNRADLLKRGLRASIFGPAPVNDYFASRVIFKEKGGYDNE